MASVSVELKQKIDEWLKWDRNEKTLAIIQQLVDERNYDELSKLLLQRVSFGTAGIRGRMQPGYIGMNDLVIIQTSQGLLKYLESINRQLLVSNGIVIGYDGRYNSKRFAELTASIFLHAGYPVKLFNDYVPTPFIPFSVKKYQSSIGIMITASHNPKDDNGYKVYGDNSAQIVSPVDKNIQKAIIENLTPLPTSWDTTILENNKLLHNPLQDVLNDYIDVVIKKSLLPQHIEINQKTDLVFTYTPMHGVGYQYIEKIFNIIGIKMVPVEEQKDPHPDFPTVTFPNPEEGKSSLDLAIKTADTNNSRIIIANDPDADRMAAAEKHPITGTWKIFNGNELGALLGWWMYNCFKLKNPQVPLDNVYMLSSTVSSMILKSMAKREGFNFIETLTGFKWMGNKAFELLGQGKYVIFAFEEAIGFMCNCEVLDKDGISAAANFTTLASYLYNQNRTLTDKLEEIYQTYGYHISNNSYFICHDKEKIRAIFEKIRNHHGPNTYPNSIRDGEFEITTIRDLTTGFDSSQPDQKAILPVSKSSEMITFGFSNGLVCTLRTSGTEPKIKYYTELCAAPGQSKESVKATLDVMVDAIVDEMLQPELNQLQPRLE